MSFMSTSLVTRLAFASFTLLPIAPLAHADDPQPSAQKPAEKPVYDEAAVASADIKAALGRARKENRRVLVQWGANWCVWCRVLHGSLTKNADIAKKLQYEYDVVHVDVGRFDKNTDLAAEYGVSLESIPRLTVLDASGKVIAQHDTVAFETELDGKQAHDAKKLLAFLTEHQAKPLDAAQVRDAAFARAKAEGKRVFLHHGAPWCGWCHRLENWMAQPDVAALLGKEFVDLKIDTDRMTGGAEMLAAQQLAAGVKKASGIPWFVFCDADGKVLATSEGPEGNTGFPYQDPEIAHFGKMLELARAKLTDADIAALCASLTAVRRADEEKKKAGTATGGTPPAGTAPLRETERVR